MRKAFVTALRLLARFAREPAPGAPESAAEREYALRETINAQFDQVHALADGVLFEFGRSRPQNLASRDRIREWLPQLRTLFLMRIASWKYRAQLPGFELPEVLQAWQRQYDERSADLLDELADRIEGKAQRLAAIPELGPLPREGSFGALLTNIDLVTRTVAASIVASDTLIGRDASQIRPGRADLGSAHHARRSL
jgi:transposase